MFKKKFFKSWQVCDWLAKWLKMLGFIDLRQPRVVRHSNVGLVWSLVSSKIWYVTSYFPYFKWGTISTFEKEVPLLPSAKCAPHSSHVWRSCRWSWSKRKLKPEWQVSKSICIRISSQQGNLEEKQRNEGSFRTRKSEKERISKSQDRQCTAKSVVDPMIDFTFIGTRRPTALTAESLIILLQYIPNCCQILMINSWKSWMDFKIITLVITVVMMKPLNWLVEIFGLKSVEK